MEVLQSKFGEAKNLGLDILRTDGVIAAFTIVQLYLLLPTY